MLTGKLDLMVLSWRACYRTLRCLDRFPLAMLTPAAIANVKNDPGTITRAIIVVSWGLNHQENQRH